MGSIFCSWWMIRCSFWGFYFGIGNLGHGLGQLGLSVKRKGVEFFWCRGVLRCVPAFEKALVHLI